jgi:gluconate 2-dehydrogenase subunit 3-like protein
MKRRRFVQSLPLLSATPALLALPQVSMPVATPDAVAKPVPRFFSPPQLAALRRLSDLIMPAIAGTPGALEAGAPEFLDFLIGASPLPRRALYRSGLDALNTRAIAAFGKAFTALDDAQAATLLTPLHEPWTWGDQRTKDPKDVFAVFLRTAKADILAATVNSREWIEVVSQRSRNANGIGTYWLPSE